MKKRLQKILETVYYRFLLIPRISRNYRLKLREVRKRRKARVAFIMSSLPMWRAQRLYDLLKEDTRFQIIQAIFPFPTFSDEQNRMAINQLVAYCKSRNMPLIDLSSEKNPGTVLKEHFNPDLIFYPQPYNSLYSNDLDSQFFSDCLVCYLPYATPTAKEAWTYHNYLNNIAWRLYYQSETQKKEAKRFLYNNGRNIRVVGEPMTDLFSCPAALNPWKNQGTVKKRVIWAPHFSIVDEGFLHRDSFTWLSEAMWKIAQRFQDRIQFAFKPHPRLMSVLYGLPEWGKERTDAYYASWANGCNTQLETGNYIDLFKTSDAMVHDCSSFSVEYHYTGKPVMFITNDVSAVTDKLNEFGREAILAHYLGKTAEDIAAFLEDVVLNGQDPMYEVRKQFKERYLSSPLGKKVAENIYQDILLSLGFEK